jgi:hypothetical protein
MLRIVLVCAAAWALPDAAAAQIGPFDPNWDWMFNSRNLTFSVDPATPPILANGAIFAASNLAALRLGEVARPSIAGAVSQPEKRAARRRSPEGARGGP